MRERITKFDNRVETRFYVEFLSDSLRIFYGSMTLIFDECQFLKSLECKNVSVTQGQFRYLINKYLCKPFSELNKQGLFVTESDNLQFEFL